MKTKFMPLPPQPDFEPHLANGWLFNPKNKQMELYRDGIIIQMHLCSKKFYHDIYDEREDLFAFKPI